MNYSLFTSGLALVVSITTAWFSLFRRGSLKITQPVLLGFLYEENQPKVFLRAMLYATGKRGQMVEALYLRVKRGDETQIFGFWMYGETKSLMIGSGLRIGEDGVSSNHHFLPPKDETSFTFLPGRYIIDLYARRVNRSNPIHLCTVDLRLSEQHAQYLHDRTHWAVFTREPDAKGYRCQISEERISLSVLG